MPSQSLHRPYVKLFTEKSVEHFLLHFHAKEKYISTLVIVCPYISDLQGEVFNLNGVVKTINKEKIRVYIITRSPEEDYQKVSMDLLYKSPNIEIRYNNNIHAKLFLCWCKNEDDSFALFGSGNLTRGGISLNIELGMMVYAHSDGRKIIRKLYSWSTDHIRFQSKIIKSFDKK